MNLSLLVGGFAVSALFGAACAASSNGTTFTSGSGGSGGGSGDGGSGGETSTTTPGTLSGASDAVGDVGSGSMSGDAGPESCAASQQKAQQIPLDMFVMLDKSGSMKESVGASDRWTAVTGALGAFLKQPNTAGISVGIQYFGQPKAGAVMCPNSCTKDADCGDPTCGKCFVVPFFGGFCDGAATVGGDSCDATVYAKPAVEISSLPAAADMLINSMKGQTPDGGTPTSAALAGAVQHAKEWAMKNPSHVTIAVFATDGDPGECDTSIAGISKIASDAFGGTPKVPTYVIGVGKSVSNLNAFAVAGGTGAAFLVEDANANTKFLEAMNAIRGSALSCNYQIPKPATGTPDFDAVNVQYTAGGEMKGTVFPKVADKSKCVAGTSAWYYDNNTNPTQIILCDDTCTKLSKDTKGQVDILLGCKTVVK